MFRFLQWFLCVNCDDALHSVHCTWAACCVCGSMCPCLPIHCFFSQISLSKCWLCKWSVSLLVSVFFCLLALKVVLCCFESIKSVEITYAYNYDHRFKCLFILFSLASRFALAIALPVIIYGAVWVIGFIVFLISFFCCPQMWDFVVHTCTVNICLLCTVVGLLLVGAAKLSKINCYQMPPQRLAIQVWAQVGLSLNAQIMFLRPTLRAYNSS